MKQWATPPARLARAGVEHRDELLVRIAFVQEHGLTDLGRELELRRERAPLRVARRVVAKEVEAAFADGDEGGIREQRAEGCRRMRVELRRMVRVHARGREQALRGAPRTGPRLARCS